MSFHVVRHEHPAIFVVNRQTYETYRFTIGDNVALAHVGPPSDLAEARRTALAFLAQKERENAPREVCCAFSSGTVKHPVAHAIADPTAR
jgi:hypothetical protein